MDEEELDALEKAIELEPDPVRDELGADLGIDRPDLKGDPAAAEAAIRDLVRLRSGDPLLTEEEGRELFEAQKKQAELDAFLAMMKETTEARLNAAKVAESVLRDNPDDETYQVEPTEPTVFEAMSSDEFGALLDAREQGLDHVPGQGVGHDALADAFTAFQPAAPKDEPEDDEWARRVLSQMRYES